MWPKFKVCHWCIKASSAWIFPAGSQIHHSQAFCSIWFSVKSSLFSKWFCALLWFRAGTSDYDREARNRLPTSATCVNLLKLPPYNRWELNETTLGTLHKFQQNLFSFHCSQQKSLKTKIDIFHLIWSWIWLKLKAFRWGRFVQFV